MPFEMNTDATVPGFQAGMREGRKGVAEARAPTGLRVDSGDTKTCRGAMPSAARSTALRWDDHRGVVGEDSVAGDLSPERLSSAFAIPVPAAPKASATAPPTNHTFRGRSVPVIFFAIDCPSREYALFNA